MSAEEKKMHVSTCSIQLNKASEIVRNYEQNLMSEKMTNSCNNLLPPVKFDELAFIFEKR